MISKKEKENNLRMSVMETFKMNGATNEEIIKVCNSILKKLKFGIDSFKLEED